MGTDAPSSTASHRSGERISHDQNFKNLILDYPRQALAFFAREEADDIDVSAEITPIRQEQLKDRLGDRFLELDVPLLVTWPDGRLEALVFVLEEESDPHRFSVHRLASYCVAIAELMNTNEIVPVVIFLRGNPSIPRSLRLGTRRMSYLDFRYIACILPEIPVDDFLGSDNIVARLNLVSMQYPAARRVEIYAEAVRGLLALERNRDKQLKYMDYIDIYLPLADNERQAFEQHYPQENQHMMGRIAQTIAQAREEAMRQGWQEGVQRGIEQGIERGIEKGIEKGIEQGIERGLEQGLERGLSQGMQAGIREGLQQGRQEHGRQTLIRLATLRFGPLPHETESRIQQASADELDHWIGRILDARNLDDLFRVQ